MNSRKQVTSRNITLKEDYKKIALEKTRECEKLKRELKQALSKIESITQLTKGN
jgi:hypothetical protein